MNTFKACRYGVMCFNTNDNTVGKSLEHYGEYSEGEVVLFKHLIQTNQIVFDVGAHIGCHTVVFSRLVGENGTVLAFEPQRMLYYTLCGNIAMNNLSNVYCLHNAVAAKDGRINIPELNYRELNDFGFLKLNEEYTQSKSRVSVKQVTIDSFHQLPHFIKIDTPSMELDVLIGASETIAKHRPILYINNSERDKQVLMINYVKSLGYRVWMHGPLMFNANNYQNNLHNIFENKCSINMLCYHKDTELSINPQQFNCIECVGQEQVMIASAGKEDSQRVIEGYRTDALNKLISAAHAFAELQHNLPEAMKHLDMAISMDPHNWQIYHQAAPILTRFGMTNEALAYTEQALEYAPEDAKVLVLRNKAILISELGRFKEAITLDRVVLEKLPEDQIFQFNLSLDLLADGQFKEGWEKYEWRFKGSSPALIDFMYSLPKIPFWNGEDLRGKKLLVFTEQGIGDQIYFARYLNKLKATGAHMLMTCHEHMEDILKCYGVELYVHNIQERFPKDCDYMISLMSLGRFFGEIPNMDRYIEPIKGKEFEASKKFNIGICWTGSEVNGNDWNRSLPLKHFKPLAEMENVQLYSLQKGSQRRYWPWGEVNLYDGAHNMDMIDITHKLKTVNDTANLIDKLDLVISVCTSVAHLSGALGKKTYLMLGKKPYWYWICGTKWYNSMEYFFSEGNWDKTIAEIKDEILKVKK